MELHRADSRDRAKQGDQEKQSSISHSLALALGDLRNCEYAYLIRRVVFRQCC